MFLKELITAKHYRATNIPGGDLRLSITAACNMRCNYCHNEGQGDFQANFMAREDAYAIVEGALRFGLRKVRLTGGEPLLHPEIVELCRGIKSIIGARGLGLNTNAMLTHRFHSLLSYKFLDQVVVGIDYFDSHVSKDSPIGQSSEVVLSNVLEAKKSGHNVQIACVYNGNYENARALVQWSLKNNILIKILEVSDNTLDTSPDPDFVQMRSSILNDFKLKLGVTADLNEYYGYDDLGTRVLFFHSHCRLRQCHECSLMHLRVAADGHAQPCILDNRRRYQLLGTKMNSSYSIAINNLGIPPERAFFLEDEMR